LRPDTLAAQASQSSRPWLSGTGRTRADRGGPRSTYDYLRWG